MHTWILVLFLAGEPLAAVGPFTSAEACVARAETEAKTLKGSAWEEFLTFGCFEREPRAPQRGDRAA